jgi:hypothetical protein
MPEHDAGRPAEIPQTGPERARQPITSYLPECEVTQEVDAMLVSQASGKSGVLGDEKIVMRAPGLFQIQQLANMPTSRCSQADA